LVPALSTNDTELELQAVLAGQVIGQISNLSAAEHIRSRRLVPVLLQHVSEHIGVHACTSTTATARRSRGGSGPSSIWRCSGCWTARAMW
jgi:DNA-binding transcriptional LysR family regulator